jgi:hypothetical protein
MSVVKALEKALEDSGVRVMLGARVMTIRRDEGMFLISLENATEVLAEKIVLATGGASYKATGSTGDGFHFAKLLGHKCNPLRREKDRIRGR